MANNNFNLGPLPTPPPSAPLLIYNNFTMIGTSSIRVETPTTLREQITWVTFINVTSNFLQITSLDGVIVGTTFSEIPPFTTLSLPLDIAFRDGFFVYYTEPSALGIDLKRLTIIWSDRNLGYDHIGSGASGGGTAVDATIVGPLVGSSVAVSGDMAITSPLDPGPSVRVSDWMIDIARGTVSPASSVYINGNGSSSAGFTARSILNDLTATATATSFFSTAGQQIRLISTSANDSSAGTGARQIKIYYLDSTFTPQTETITLNGLTAVNSVNTNYAYFTKAITLVTGSGGTAAGNITIQNITNTLFYARILAGNNQTQSGQFTVPIDKTLYINSLNVGCVGTGYYLIIEANVDPYTNAIINNYQQLYINSVNAPTYISVTIPFKFLTGVTILLKAQSFNLCAPVAEISGFLE